LMRLHVSSFFSIVLVDGHCVKHFLCPLV
jgi:hypothetical protein